MVAHHSVHSSIHPSSSRAFTTLAPGWTPPVKPGVAPRCILGCRLCDSRYRDIKYPHHLYFNLSIYCQSVSANPTSLPLAIVPGCYLAFDLPVRYRPGILPSQPYRLLFDKKSRLSIFSFPQFCPICKIAKLAVMVFVGSDTDVERGGGSTEEKDLAIQTEVTHSAAERTPNYDKQSGFFARAQELTGRFGVEQRGIERVLPHERTDTSVSKVGTLVRTTLKTETDETCAPRARCLLT